MKMEHANTVTTPLWYALRDLSRSHSKNPAYRVLSDEGFEVFTPMTRRLFTENGRRVSREVPFMHDLLFVHEARERLDAAVGRLTNLQYRFARGGYRVPITVPDRNMEYFIRAVAGSDEPRYFRPEEITPRMLGKRVRVIGGGLDGYEGRLLSARGSKRRRLLVEIPTFLTAAVEVSPDLIEIME